MIGLNVCLLLTVYCLLGLSGCDEPFQPLQDSDTAPFSIFGYLDASADTQWVRVTPVREQVDLPPVVPEMLVTIEHLQSGNTAVMNDSLILFPDDFHILNAWAVTDILKPEQTYRLQAERPDGAASSVTVTLPEDFQIPVLHDFGDGCRATLRINGVNRLADVQSKWHVRILFLREGKIIEEEDRVFSFPYRRKAERVAAGSYTVFINTNSELDQLMNQLLIPPGVELEIQVLSRQIFVASGGSEWIEDIASLDDVIYALPEVLSNVENGVGYMAGIVSKTIPYESCFQ